MNGRIAFVKRSVACAQQPPAAGPGRLAGWCRAGSGDLDIVIEVRTKLFEHRVQDKQRRVDLIGDRLSSLPLGQVGVWLIHSEGACSQS